jgi:hypothetical protein
MLACMLASVQWQCGALQHANQRTTLVALYEAAHQSLHTMYKQMPQMQPHRHLPAALLSKPQPQGMRTA